MLSLSIFVYSTPLADRECACADEIAIRNVYRCLIYIYIVTIRLPNPACLLGVMMMIAFIITLGEIM